MRFDQIPSDTGWVSELLASQPSPSAPDDVVESVLGAIADEQEVREAATRAKGRDPLGELLNRTSTGTFGANVPSHYTRKGLGISRSSAAHK
ncbi:hypothetical protein [Acidipropionibacterium virtanenii]|uniref:Uncharacterized protein n=1 Tax=Acidipropionibacterium virtanenii TaxID=2057246 RepID=A0A344UQ02_9ACTN|nr:hypothetical protein [Acidipropionibacterium virtanenii]AXE37350.1 hypothetical protein JS278_00153 [Acidipropionibacterium virtanenii]